MLVDRITSQLKHSRLGFALTELLATIALIGILGSMIVSLIPAIVTVMNTVTTKARAEMLVTNTVTVLRNYMRYSSDVEEIGENRYRFKGEDNWIYEISIDDGNGGWIVVAPCVKQDNSVTQLEIDENSLVQDWHLLTNKAASENLIPTFERITYSDGLFTIEGLKVTNENGDVKTVYHGSDNNPKAQFGNVDWILRNVRVQSG